MRYVPFLYFAVFIAYPALVERGSCQPRLEISQRRYLVSEGKSFDVTVRKTGSHIRDIVAVLQFKEREAVYDFRGSSYVLHFRPDVDQIRKTFFVESDDIPEGSETYHLSLRILPGSDDALPGPDAIVVIEASDDAYGVLGFQLNEVLIREGGEPAVIGVSRTKGATGRVFAQITVSKANNNDIEFSASSVVFADQQRQAVFQLSAVDDPEPEDEEEFFIELTSVSNGARTNASTNRLRVMIPANDAPIRFLKTSYSTAEGNTTVDVVLTRGQIIDPLTGQARKVGPLSTHITVPYSLISTSPECKAGVDFVSKASEVVFEPGVLEQKIRVAIIDDHLPETDEQFAVELRAPKGDAVLIPPERSIITIRANDDPHGILEFASDKIMKAAHEQGPVRIINEDTEREVRLKINRLAGSFGQISVNWTISRIDSLEPPDSDLGPTTGTITFLEGEIQKEITTFVVQDAIPEKVETFRVFLKPNSVKGGARVALGSHPAVIVLQDSDKAHGVVEFADPKEQKIIALSGRRRGLRLLLSRQGGTAGDLIVNYIVEFQYDGTRLIGNLSGILETRQTQLIMPDCEKSYQFILPINDSAFLPVGSAFTVRLLNVSLSPRTGYNNQILNSQVTGHEMEPFYPPFNSPIIGEKKSTTVAVDLMLANGELGFSGPSVIYVEEAVDKEAVVDISIYRNGTSGDAWVDWEIVSKDQLLVPGEDFILPENRSLLIKSGSESATLRMIVLPDVIPELEEEIVLRLTNVRPRDSQRLSVNGSTVKVIVRENDNPAGMFSLNPSGIITMEEGKEPIALTIRRSGGYLANRTVEVYALEDVNRTEFVGLPAVIEFREGLAEHKISFMAANDNIPELQDRFTVTLRSFQGPPLTINHRMSTLTVHIPDNNDPHGVFQFSEKDISIELPEGGEAKELTIVRARGVFGSASVGWQIEFIPQPGSAAFADPAKQFQTSSGKVIFVEGERSKNIVLSILDDAIPEPLEHYQVRLIDADGGARLSRDPSKTTANVFVPKNDYRIEFAGDDRVTVKEGATLQMDILREDVANKCTVRLSTTEKTAKAVRDFSPYSAQLIVLEPHETHKVIFIDIYDDDEPEADETFQVVLSDSTGQCVAFGTTNVTATIANNDEAAGVFRFEPPGSYAGEEGVPVKVGIIREKSYFNSVKLFWQVVTLAGSKEFSPPNGTVIFQEGEIVKKFDLMPLDDELPEFNETYEIELVQLFDSESARIALSGSRASITILENDNPYGLITFPIAFREVEMDEDYIPGRHKKMEVYRLKGLNGTIKAIWELYSYEIAGKIPPFLDLLLDAPDYIIRHQELRRPATETDVFQLKGEPVFLTKHRIPGESFFSEGFALSVWIRPAPARVGQPSFIFSKVNLHTGLLIFGVGLQLGSPNELIAQIGSYRLTAELPPYVNDGNWRFVACNCEDKIGAKSKADSENGGYNIGLYLDGQLLKNLNFNSGSCFAIAEQGRIVLGADGSGRHPFHGFVQDFRLYSRPIQPGEMQELFALPSRSDIGPVNGYLNFSSGDQSKYFILSTVDDAEEESNEVFSVKLMDVSGGAEILSTDGSAKVTVLKSDNANGLFLLKSCKPNMDIHEGEPINCTIERVRGDADQVAVGWHINEVFLDGREVLAKSDFVQADGDIIFNNGVRSMVLTLIPKMDGEAEEAERFILLLQGTAVADGEVGSTPTSGASIHPDFDRVELWLKPNDWPNGLFQFCSSSPCSEIKTPIRPLETLPTIIIAEEAGSVVLTVQRAQGVKDKVTVEFRTVDGTAKAHTDYQAKAGSIGLDAHEHSAKINVTIFDNTDPEGPRYFFVELLNPTGGSQISQIAGRAKIIIAESDYPYGVFMFEDSTCGSQVAESDGENIATIPLRIVRSGGAYDSVQVSWQVSEEGAADVRPSSGIVNFRKDQQVATVLVEVVDDELPELPEIIIFELLNSSRGIVAPNDTATCNFTIAANDNPYGEFFIDKHFRPMVVRENQGDIFVKIGRRGGLFGRIKVDVLLLDAKDEPPAGRMPRKRANLLHDFVVYNEKPVSVYFDEGQSEKQVRIGAIKEDELPEDDETFFVVLSSVEVADTWNTNRMLRFKSAAGHFNNTFMAMPTIANEAQTYAEIVIAANDDANGVLRFSDAEVSVDESGQLLNASGRNYTEDFPLRIIRERGWYGKVGVKFRLENGTAIEHQDFEVNGGYEVWFEHGETEKPLPLLIVNDLMPEMEEVFAVSLIPESAMGGVGVTNPKRALITIAASDSPNGLLVFRQPAYQSVEEPQGNRIIVRNIIVRRKRGLTGIVKATWTATINDKPATNDVFPVNGTVFINSGADSASITLYVLADDEPEIDELIEIRIQSAIGGADLGPQSKRIYRLTIKANDNPHGSVGFATPSYFVSENAAPLRDVIIRRNGGAFGTLYINYAVEALNCSDMLTTLGERPINFFYLGFIGYRRSSNSRSFRVVTTRYHSSNEMENCQIECLADRQCEAFDIGVNKNGLRMLSSNAKACRLWMSGQGFDKRRDSVTSSDSEYWIKKKYKVEEKLYGRWAVGDGIDFESGSFMAVIPSGMSNASLPVHVIADGNPELNETFRVRLVNVQLGNWSDANFNPENRPIIAMPNSALVTILENSYANGQLMLSLLSGGNFIEVDEADRAIELVITRQGGSMGFISVTWAVDESSSATPVTDRFTDGDFTGDSATLYFAPGVTVQTFSLSIKDDDLPENREEIIVFLKDAVGGAVLSTNSTVVIRILANDHVAGLIGFENASYIVSEGDTVALQVYRTRPAKGKVIVPWIVVDQFNNKANLTSISLNRGKLHFHEDETTLNVTLYLIPDNIPEFGEKYIVRLRPPETLGIDNDGGSILNQNQSSVVIFVRPSNEPHGIFALVREVSRYSERDPRPMMQVKRRGGIFGDVIITYTVEPAAGTRRSFRRGLSVGTAEAGKDFRAQREATAIMRNGTRLLNIPLGIINDDVPELDEIFAFRLNAVKLSPHWVKQNRADFVDRPTPPRISAAMSSGFAVIAANDGTLGKLAFRNTHISVSEKERVIPIVVERHRGDFGNVSVYIYASARTTLTSDFKFTDQTIHFAPGQRNATVNLTIVDDAIPEPPELIELILASPNPEGVVLGVPQRLTIEIRANDGAAGTIGFAMPPEPIRLSEPNERAGALSNVTIFVERRPGHFGVSSVQVHVVPLSDYPTEGNIMVSNTSLVFMNGQSRVSFWIAVVDDNIPEEPQRFEIILKKPTGGARLDPSALRLFVNISASDHPRGLIKLCLREVEDAPCGKNFVVEELPGQQHLPLEVTREHGTSGNISVDLITVPRQASITRDGNKIFLSPLQMFYGSETVRWHAFRMYGFTYFLLLSSNVNGPLASFEGFGKNDSTSDAEGYPFFNQRSTDHAEQSTWFRWQGSLVAVQPILTDNAIAATSFEDEGIHYLVIANFGMPARLQSKVRIYRVLPDGTLISHQDIESVGTRDIAVFRYGSQLHLAMANFADENGNTVLQLGVHEWSRRAHFFFDAAEKTTRTEGARRVLPFHIRGNTYVLVVNYLATEFSENGLSCRLYWYGLNSGHFELKQGIEVPSAIDAEFASLNELDHFLAIATAKSSSSSDPSNQTEHNGDSIIIYKWHSASERFVPVQSIDAARVRQLSFLKSPKGNWLELITAEEAGPSRIFRWSQDTGKFLPVWSGHSACGMYPTVIQQPSLGQPLEVLVATNCDGIRSVVYSINRIDSSLSDFAPLGITFTFLNYQRGPLTSFVTILDDDEPEVNETFVLQLRNPVGNCDLAENQSSVDIKIKANDDAYGYFEFANDSLLVEVDEIIGMSNVVFLNVFRQGGTNGEARVRWQVSPPDGGYRDISPLFGELVFSTGQNAARIQLSIPDDIEPELDEIAYVTLQEIGPSSAEARIGEQRQAKVIIMANDSPHGVIGWESVEITAYEEPRDYRKTVFIVREQGTEGVLEVRYKVSASTKNKPVRLVLDGLSVSTRKTGAVATPGADFVPVIDGKVTLANGQKRVPIGITIIADDLPEEVEQFTLNLTSVSLAKGERRRGGPPSIKRQRQKAIVVIPANDDANGVIEFDISQLPASVTAYEIAGQDASLELPIVRHTGSAGRLVVHWESHPSTASPNDFSPSMGTITFEDGQKTAGIIMAVLDDEIPENDEAFDVILTQVVGGGRLGIFKSVKIVIKRNDSPHGVFSFDLGQPIQMFDAINAPDQQTPPSHSFHTNYSLIIAEPVQDFDPAGQLTIRVVRRHGTDGTVKLRWVLGSNATEDFLPPYTGVLTFSPGETVKDICLRAKADDELEGTEAFILSLIPNDTLAELAPVGSDVIVIIRADPGASGVVRIKPGYESVTVAEPSESGGEYDGKVEIVLLRENGIYGNVVVDWQIVPAGGRGRFLASEGQAVFEDRHNEASIVLQARNDNIPQMLETFELRLLSAVASAASLDHNHSTVAVSIVASDWPYGLFRLKSESTIFVEEDAKLVRLTVERLFGTTGSVDVEYTTSADDATTNDFTPVAGSLTFLTGQTRATIEIPIVDDEEPEPNEQFFVNLTSVLLRPPHSSNINLTRIDVSATKWVTPDLAPTMDAESSSVTVVISANDNAAGIIAFLSDSVIAQEESGRVELVVTRQPGTYGRILVYYRIEAVTARWTEDFLDFDGEFIIADGENRSTVSIRLTDDAMPEYAETFRVHLINATGGAVIDRAKCSAEITIAKSDYPNGRFAFVGVTQLKLPNLLDDTEYVARIERTGGLRSSQILSWKLYGPNDKTLPTRTNKDICVKPQRGEHCIFQDELRWNNDEGGWRDLIYTVRGHRNIWETEKRYWLVIEKVQAVPQLEKEAGEIDPTASALSITLAKYGRPNGVFRFVRESLDLRTVSEPEITEMTLPLTFRVERRNNSMGQVRAKWQLRGPVDSLSADVLPMSGEVSFEDGQAIADFTIFVQPDDVPELSEQFVVALVGATGGAEIDNTDIFAQFVIRANDSPYGVFAINSSNQRVVVKRSDMSRTLMLNFSRLAGTFGRARLTYNVRHESPPGRASGLLPQTGHVEFEEGKPWAMDSVKLSRESHFFLHPDSNFTIRLTRVELLDSPNKALPPVIAHGNQPTLDSNFAELRTTSEAANSIVSFENPVSLVDEATGVARVVVLRYGTYGNMRLYWAQDNGKEGQFTPGRLEPSEGSLDVNHGEERAVIWVRPAGEAEPCRVYRIKFVGNRPDAHVDGGAEFGPNEDHRATDIERYGLVRVAETSREVKATEDSGRITVTVERLYGSLAPLMVYYSVSPGSATPGVDYATPSAGSVLIANGQSSASISLSINQDAEPEPAEYFFVNLTRVVKLPTDVAGPDVQRSPRISQIFNASTVTIAANSDPFGVLTIDTGRGNISESNQLVDIVINRLVGVAGEVAVTVRTASTSEPWLVEVERTTLWPVLSSRPTYTIATTEIDYNLLDRVVVLAPGQRQAKLQIRLTDDDTAEGDETFAVYLSRPVGGARLASETEGKWFKMVTIDRNDMWNGRVGFDYDQQPLLNEDTRSTVKLALRRSLASFDDVFVSWEAVETTKTPKLINIQKKLVEHNGRVQCKAFAKICYFNISLHDDQVPETEWEFAIRLSSAHPGATLDSNTSQIIVKVANSDDPFGLIRFAPESVLVPISQVAAAATLRVQRLRGADRTVRVDVKTYQLPEEVASSGGEMLLPAIDKVDFHHIAETIVFRPGVMAAEVIVPLGGPVSPTRRLPRLFQVVLTNPTSGARVDENYAVANVTIVHPEELTSWQAVAQALIADVDVGSTLKLVKDTAASVSLSDAQLSRLESVLSATTSRPLSPAAREAAFSTLCHLANPERKDAVVGRTSLARILEKLVLASLQQTTNCSTTAPTAYQQFYSDSDAATAACSHFNFQAVSAKPSELRSRTRERGFTFRGRHGDWVRLPDKLIDKISTVSMTAPSSADNIFAASSPSCANVAFIEYSSTVWFDKAARQDGMRHEMIGGKVLTVTVPNEELLWRSGDRFGVLDVPVEYRVHMPNHAIAPSHARCFYMESATVSVSSGWHDELCTVENDLSAGTDDYVQCRCRHFSSYGARIPRRNGYPPYFPIFLTLSCCFLLATLICHHARSPHAQFSASLNMHLIFASFATQLIYAIDVLLSKSHLLVLTTLSTSDHYKCTIIGIILHYFFVAQFTWIFTQALNLWRIFVLNDEHTRRKYVWFFMLGWGVPAVVVAAFYAGAFHVFKSYYSSSTRAETAIYGNVGNFGDMCFVTDAVAGAVGVIVPAVVSLLAAAGLLVHAFQMRAQWHAYDDVYRGRYNSREVSLLLPWWALMAFTWLWGGLYLAFTDFWWLVLFLAFSLIQSVYGFFTYGICRTPCFDRVCCLHCTDSDSSVSGSSALGTDRLIGTRNLPAGIHHMGSKHIAEFSDIMGPSSDGTASSTDSNGHGNSRPKKGKKGGVPVGRDNVAAVFDEAETSRYMVGCSDDQSTGSAEVICGYDETSHLHIAQHRQQASTVLPPGARAMPDFHL